MVLNQFRRSFLGKSNVRHVMTNHNYVSRKKNEKIEILPKSSLLRVNLFNCTENEFIFFCVIDKLNFKIV